MSVTAPILHSDQVMLAQMVGENISLAKETGLSVDGDVGGSNTAATMATAISTAAAAKHADFQGFVGRLQRMYQYYGKDDGIMSDANVQGASTLADLVGISGADSNKRGPLGIG